MDQVIRALSTSGAIHTINDLNTRFEVGGRRVRGDTNPAYVYTVIDGGPNAASFDDIKVLTDSLGYVLSQGSAFLLDADDTASFDFPANYVVLNFGAPPSIKKSAALFETVGRIDPELFETDSSGYTQFGRAYLSLQSFVPTRSSSPATCRRPRSSASSTRRSSVGCPAVPGGAAFPGNDWTEDRRGRKLPGPHPAQSHKALGRIRASHLRSPGTRSGDRARVDDETGTPRAGCAAT